jgi:aminoglycoside phosphotransferase (APT) family kinase protein
MALLNKLDAEAATRQLGAWLAGKLPDAEEVAVSDVKIPQSAGMSMTTILFDATCREGGEEKVMHLVARVAPETPGVFKDPDLAREFRVIRALGESTPVEVPTARWLEEDPSVLGSPFVVSDRAYGEVPSDDPPYVVEGWVLELDPADRGKLYENTLQVIKQIHAVDWNALGLDFLDESRFGELGIDQQIGHWEDFYAWAHAGQPSPTIDAALEWAKENKPSGEDLVLNWGDPRIGNVMFDPSDLTPQAVLDWEMATIASPEMDLGWFVFFVRYYSEGIGVEIPAGLQTGEELVARYEEITGREVKHVAYYEAFAALRLAILMMRAGQLMIAGGALPPDNPMPFSNPASQLLAKLLGLPAPAGEATSFVGNR